jgi:hypothetical protein
MKVAVELSNACNANLELVMAHADPREPASVDDGLNRLHRGVDTRLELLIDQSADGLTFSARADGDGRPLQTVGLNQDQDAFGREVLPRSLEGMDHALNRDSSK